MKETGTRSIRRFLQSLPAEATQGLKDTLLLNAKVVQADAIKLAYPLRLKQALFAPGAIGVRSNGLVVEFGLRRKAQKKLAYFAHWIEFGVKPHSLKKGARSGGHGRSWRRLSKQKDSWHPGVPEKPFLRPAAFINRSTNRRIVYEQLRIATYKALALSRNG